MRNRPVMRAVSRKRPRLHFHAISIGKRDLTHLHIADLLTIAIAEFSVLLEDILDEDINEIGIG